MKRSLEDRKKRAQGLQGHRTGMFRENFSSRIQTVDVWKPKFQSIPLCAVDLHFSSLRTGCSFSKEGVHEA